MTELDVPVGDCAEDPPVEGAGDRPVPPSPRSRARPRSKSKVKPKVAAGKLSMQVPSGGAARRKSSAARSVSSEAPDFARKLPPAAAAPPPSVAPPLAVVARRPEARPEEELAVGGGRGEVEGEADAEAAWTSCRAEAKEAVVAPLSEEGTVDLEAGAPRPELKAELSRSRWKAALRVRVQEPMASDDSVGPVHSCSSFQGTATATASRPAKSAFLDLLNRMTTANAKVNSFQSMFGRTFAQRGSVSSEEGTLRPMDDDVKIELLRGVRIDRALRLFGTHWTSNVGSGWATPEEEYALSEKVPKIDDFITHDWHTGRWWKFIALTVVYNAQAALVASVLVSITICILEMPSVSALPYVYALYPASPDTIAGVVVDRQRGCFAMIVSPLVFVFFLLFWQRIRSASRLCRRRYAFVDKLCINQTDEALKAEGITSLAGFLRHTDRLVMLWSPSYFKRLWCVYEVASWLHFERDFSRTVRFMPVTMAGMVLVLHFGCFMFYLLLRLTAAVSGYMWVLLVLLLVFLSSTGPFHTLRHLSRDLMQLPEQLEEFSFLSADCFCCAHNHKHPDTGEQMPCDRRLVCGTLGEWLRQVEEKVSVGSSSAAGLPVSLHATDEAGVGDKTAFVTSTPSGKLHKRNLEAFNHIVRTRVKESVKHMGNLHLPYRSTLIISVPCFWYAADNLGMMEILPPMAAARYLGHWLSIYLLVIPIALAAQVSFIRMSVPQVGRLNSRVLDVLISVGFAFAFVVTVAVVWFPVFYALRLESWVPQLVVLIAHILATVALYAPWPPWWRGQPEEALKGDIHLASIQAASSFPCDQL